MFDIDRIVTALKTDSTARGAGVAGLAAGVLLGGGVKKAITYGALAAIGSVAYNAWQKNRQGGDFTPVDTPPTGPFMPSQTDEAAREELGKALVRAMIAAAKADGGIDADEKQRIFTRLESMNLSAADKAFVFDELSAPLDLEAVVRGADTPEHAAEIYAASLVAIEGTRPEELRYLETLAARLNLPDTLVSEIHAAAAQ